MPTPMEWFLAVRFLRDGRAQSLLIILGAGVGVGVIVFLSALINGLQASLIQQTLGSQAHVIARPPEDVARPQRRSGDDLTVLARTDQPPQRVRSIVGWQQQLETIARAPGVIASAPIASGPAFAQRGDASRAVLVRGSDLPRLAAIVPLDRKLVAGQASLSGSEALIGVQLASDLGLAVGDKLRLTTAEDVSDVYTVRGVFDLGNKDVNARWVVVPLRAAQTLLGLEGGVTELDLAVAEVFDASDIAARLGRDTGLRTESWMEVNAQLLVGLRAQSSSSLMIQVFVILAVAMGIASVLVVSVIQRSREIGILRAMGTSRARVLRVFLIQGAIVGLIGAALGSALGGGLATLFGHIDSLPDGSPRFPVQLDLALFASTTALALGTGLIAAVLPARRAARLDPAVAIRSE
ncbi:MAG: ABC transporter permease [Deltaproteobacteria bacterium]|nr:ABC transporter permease [Deltaproteobacteria bacterium]